MSVHAAPALFDRATFFTRVRADLFGGRLTKEQVEGMGTMLSTWEEREPAGDSRHLAYILATVFHETGKRMVPCTEKGGAAYFRRMYDIKGERPQVARRLGNTKPGDGARFCGRGRVMPTGKSNYAKLEKLTGQPLVERPELMLDPAVDAVATFVGMKAGIYTGKKLSDYFNFRKDDPVNARRVINGVDCAEEIAGHDAKFLRALVAARAAVKAAKVE